jgi:hypothetical protein
VHVSAQGEQVELSLNVPLGQAGKHLDWYLMKVSMQLTQSSEVAPVQPLHKELHASQVLVAWLINVLTGH